MSTEGDAREDDSSSTSSTTQHLHKSCERCGGKKRKCDGAHPCGRCIRLGEGATCSYTYRKARVTKPKPQTPGPVSVVWASENNNNSNNSNNNNSRIDASATLQVGRVVSAPSHQQYGRVSLKRCRLSPSPATGLVGMQENMFLSDYFGCVGFLPFTSQSNIRETLVKLFASSVAVRNSHSRGYSTTEQHFDSIMPADNQLPVDPSTCVFWCAVALGSLVKGRPIESVSKYSRLAREALANVSGPANAEVARAWAILAYMSDFCGDHDDFHVCLRRSSAILCDVQEQGNERLPAGLADVVKHGETIKLFVGDLDTEEVETFCSKEQANPVVRKCFLAGCSSPFMRLAEHLTALRAW